jgi:hypothetical protein
VSATTSVGRGGVVDAGAAVLMGYTSTNALGSSELVHE